MHIAVLNANVDRSEFSRGWPDDAHKVIDGLMPIRPDWQYSVWQACEGELPPADDTADGWVITGSVASVNDQLPWMMALEQRIRERHAKQQLTAGLCFGHQIIAKALGGRIGPSSGGWRLGVATTHLRPDAQALAWMQPPRSEWRLFALHQEQVLQPPEEACVLGGDGFTPHAALRVGEHIFTTQYHPELSRPFVQGVLLAYADEWPEALVARAREEFQRPVDAECFMQCLAHFFAGQNDAGSPPAAISAERLA